MNVILLVGADEVLLRTRAAVLSKTGAEVLCSDAASALAIQADRDCNLVVLCHSLGEHMSSALAEVMHERWPQTRVLMVVSDLEWGRVAAKVPVDVVSSSDPARLLGRTAELLRLSVASNNKNAAPHSGHLLL